MWTASADNECDALYANEEYLEDWVRAVQTACDQTGVRVVIYIPATVHTLRLAWATPTAATRTES